MLIRLYLLIKKNLLKFYIEKSSANKFYINHQIYINEHVRGNSYFKSKCVTIKVSWTFSSSKSGHGVSNLSVTMLLKWKVTLHFLLNFLGVIGELNSTLNVKVVPINQKSIHEYNPLMSK